MDDKKIAAILEEYLFAPCATSNKFYCHMMLNGELYKFLVEIQKGQLLFTAVRDGKFATSQDVESHPEIRNIRRYISSLDCRKLEEFA
jgi:hypothetical protein